MCHDHFILSCFKMQNGRMTFTLKKLTVLVEKLLEAKLTVCNILNRKERLVTLDHFFLCLKNHSLFLFQKMRNKIVRACVKMERLE